MALIALALALATAAPGAGAARLEWSRDYVHAFEAAQETRRPVLLHFRNGNCGGRSTPGASDDRAGAGQAGGITRPLHLTDLSDCDLMEQEVWEAAHVARAAERFACVLVDGGDQTLNARYQVVTVPTTIVTDPWGNEMLRVSHYLEPDKMRRLLDAVPKDFAALAPWARTLHDDPADPRALMGAASYYETQGLRQVSERLYEQALAAPAADATARRQASIARGLNLLMMGRGADAARVFERGLSEAPEAPGADALLLGLVNAHLTAGKRKDAEAAYTRMVRLFPDSPYTRRARENLEGARK